MEDDQRPTRLVPNISGACGPAGREGGNECSPALPQASDGSYDGGRGFFGRLELPFKSGRGGRMTLIKTFVGGYFVDNFKAACNEDTAAESSNQTCKNWKTMQNAAYDKLMGEPYRLAIRRAIATWPSA